MIDAFELVRANERGEVRGRLKEIADRLEEDDNPVLMIATFKE
jgi:t-SNARE complex subunit (syntaxin)